MSDSKCKGCEKLGRYIWLDEDDYCFHCSKKYSFKDREAIFKRMIGDKQGSYTWDEWKFIAERCSEIDFGCRFESYGCTKKIGSDRRGCCLGCAGCLGYLKAIPNEAFDVILNLFDETNGFWNGDCRLPWKYRSPVCLSYRCAILRSGENKQLWGPFYKAVGLGDRQHIEILDKLPTRWDVTTAHHYK